MHKARSFSGSVRRLLAAFVATLLACLWITFWRPWRDSKETEVQWVSAAPKAPVPFSSSADGSPAREPRMGDWLHLRVRLEDGTVPARNNLVVVGMPLQEDDGGARVAEVDEEGNARLEACAGPVDVHLVWGLAWMHHQRLSAGHGQHVLEVPVRGVVGGRLILAGGGKPPVLALTLSSPASGKGLPLPPPEVRAGMPWIPWRETVACFDLSSHDGGFRFAGLPWDWEGTLSINTADYVLSNGSESLGLAGPDPHLLLELHLRPAVTGRVVLAADGAPLEGTHILYRVMCATSVAGKSTQTAVDGRFRIPFACGDRVDVQASFVAPGVGSADLLLKDISTQESLDVGDVLLEPGRDLLLTVRAADGPPVAGATVWTAESFSVVEPTDEDGRTMIRDLSLSDVTIHVEGLGYRPEERRIALPSQNVVDVVLGRGTRLEVEVLDPAGNPVPGLFLALSAPGRIFEEEEGIRPPADQLRAGADSLRLSRYLSGGGGHLAWLRVVFQESRHGSVIVAGVLDGIPIEAEVVDATGGRVVEPVTLTLGAGEWRNLRLEVSRPARSFSGRVTDTLGSAIAKARVRVGGEDGHTVRTDAEGRFHVPLIYAEHTSVFACAPEHAPLHFPDMLLSELPEELVLVLEEGRTIDLEVQDADGAAADPDRLVAEWNGVLTGRVERVAPGRYTLSDLPTGEVDALVQIGGAELRHPLSTSSSQASLVLPRCGSVVLSWMGGRPGRDEQICLQRIDGTGFPIPVPAERSGSSRLAAVIPGSYELCLGPANVDGRVERVLLLEVVAGEETAVPVRLRD